MKKIIPFLIFLVAASYLFVQEKKEQISTTAKKTLQFWQVYESTEIYAPIINSWKEKNPQIDIRIKQFSTFDEYHQVIRQQLKKGKGPDIIVLNDETLEQNFSYLLPISNQSLSDIVSTLPENVIKKELIYAIPFSSESLMLFYNKKYYPEGIKAGWYDFAEQTKKISIGGIAMGRFDNLISGWDILQALFLQKNITLEGPPDNSWYDVLDFFTRFAYEKDRYFNWNERLSKQYKDKEIDSFAREQVAAIAGYPSLYEILLKKIKELKGSSRPHLKKVDLGISFFPQLNQEQPRYLAKHFFVGVSMNSKYPKEAWDFIRFLEKGKFLISKNEDNMIMNIQKKQLNTSGSMTIPKKMKKKLEYIVQKSLTDRTVLKEIFDY